MPKYVTSLWDTYTLYIIYREQEREGESERGTERQGEREKKIKKKGERNRERKRRSRKVKEVKRDIILIGV